MATKKFKSDVSLEQGIKLPNKTAERALIIDASGNLVESAVTSTELGYMDGVTSAVQTQMDAKADLVEGKIPSSQLPALAITEVFTAATIAARDALVVGTGDGEIQEGDVVIVTDASADAAITSGAASYIYNGTSYSLLKSGDEVLSVNGETGAVTLDATHLVHTQAVTANHTAEDGSTIAVHIDEAGFRLKTLEDATITAGVGLTRTVNDIFVNVDASTMEINVDALRVKASGITENELKNIDGEIDASSFVLPTGYSAAAGEVAAADTITAAIQKIDANVAAASHDAITLGGEALDVTNDTLSLTEQVLTVNAVTGTTDGAMLAADKAKLDLITNTNTGDNVAATTILSGIVELATQAEVTEGTDTVRVVTPATLASYVGTATAALATGSDGDIDEASFSGAADTATDLNVTGFSFLNATVRSFDAHVSVLVDAAADLYETFRLSGIQKAAGWDMSVEATGDDSLVSFTIATVGVSGQIQYSKTTSPTWVSTSIKFRAITTSV